MKCSTPGLPVHHQLPESTQTHVHWVGDAIQPSHPLSSPSPPRLNRLMVYLFREMSIQILCPFYLSIHWIASFHTFCILDLCQRCMTFFQSMNCLLTCLCPLKHKRFSFFMKVCSSVTVSLCDPTDYSMPGSSVLHNPLEFAQIHVHSVGDAVFPPPHPSVFAFKFSQHQGLSQWVSSSKSSEYSMLTSFRMNWFDLCAVQGTLKRLLQHHNLRESILWHSAFLWSNSHVCNYWKKP